MARKDNLPNMHEPDTPAKAAEYSRIQKNCLMFYDMGKKPVKTIEELETRLSDFFIRCAETGQLPTVEKMCMSIGYDRATVWAWLAGVNGCFLGLSGIDTLKKAKSYIAAFDAELLMENKVNPVAYIFRAKNYYGMVDKQEHIITPSQPLGEELTQEDIQKRLINTDEI